MKTAENEAVQQYLTAVERETSGLPADRRQELLADLAEHIEVTLAERQEQDADAVRSVLRELGDPRTIAATALGETGVGRPGPAGPTGPTAPRQPSARTRIPAWITVVLLAIATPVGLLAADFGGGVIASLLRIAGVVMLWVTLRWTTAQKTWGTVLSFACILIPNLAVLGADPVGDGALAAVHTVQVVFPLAISVWLWMTHRRD
ncbi:DUF1700 domain-containing protein [Streptomyces iconiensis]|uniref:Integral membrane protein n=1 Tax=Streptomyces iconiensis TaxID=1384038 RepID=A0ABT7A762_9ACTN|nr:hypothetical protein [Streptomyces iconiensis]MDJ1137177.1 hypothetical protein [Streptomyces iconiensis]